MSVSGADEHVIGNVFVGIFFVDDKLLNVEGNRLDALKLC